MSTETEIIAVADQLGSLARRIDCLGFPEALEAAALIERSRVLIAGGVPAQDAAQHARWSPDREIRRQGAATQRQQ